MQINEYDIETKYTFDKKAIVHIATEYEKGNLEFTKAWGMLTEIFKYRIINYAQKANRNKKFQTFDDCFQELNMKIGDVLSKYCSEKGKLENLISTSLKNKFIDFIKIKEEEKDEYSDDVRNYSRAHPYQPDRILQNKEFLMIIRKAIKAAIADSKNINYLLIFILRIYYNFSEKDTLKIVTGKIADIRLDIPDFEDIIMNNFQNMNDIPLSLSLDSISSMTTRGKKILIKYLKRYI